MEDGAEDIFTKTAANEMTIIEIANGSAIDLSCFKFRLPLTCQNPTSLYPFSFLT